MNIIRCDLCPFESSTYRFNHIYERRDYHVKTYIPRENDRPDVHVQEDIFNMDLCEECFYKYTKRVKELKDELKK